MLKSSVWVNLNKNIRAKFLQKIAFGASFFTVLLVLPSMAIPLGLPPEGDAVDYRIPLVQWIVRHHAFPNWPWSMVDDYPSLGELLMTVFYSIHPNLVRLVPIFSFVGLGIIGGKIAQYLAKVQQEKWLDSDDKLREDQNLLFWLGFAWTVSLRPLGLQSNLLMVDNTASFFLLATIYLLLKRRVSSAGFMAAGALGTRYTTWGTIAVLALFVPFLVRKKIRFRKFLLFCFLASAGALPFLVRNFVVNGNPIYPLNDPEISKVFTANYGRGKDVISFLLFPYDLLITNTFIRGFYDYTVGKLFFVQVLAFLGLSALSAKRRSKTSIQSPPKGVLVFGLLHLLIWFFLGSQQMRFLVPSLVLFLLWMLVWLWLRGFYAAIGLVTLLAVFSALSIQKDSLKIVATGNLQYFEETRTWVNHCKPLVPKEWRIAFNSREGGLGFWDRDFVFIPPHPYVPTGAGTPDADFLVSKTPAAPFVERFPKDGELCGFKKSI